MTTWNKMKISDIAEVIGGGTPSTGDSIYWGEEIPWLTPKDLSGYKKRYISKGSRSLSKVGLKNCSAKILPKGSILLTSRAPIGYLAIAEDNLCTNQGFKSLVLKEEYDSKFIYYLLKKNIDYIINMSSGSTFAEISGGQVKNLEFDIPDLETQQKIAKVLSAIDDKIELNNSINNNLEQQAQAIFKQIFSDISEDDLPSNWHKGTIGEIIELHDSKRVPLSGQQREKMKQKIYPYYGATSLMDYVDDYIFDGIYLLLGEDGTVIDTKGFPILQYVWGKFWVNNHAHILTGKNGFNVESLYLLFRQLSIKSIITGAVQAKISQTNLKSLEVIIPPIEVIENLNDKIKPLFSQIRSNLDENKVLTQLRDTLLPKLMNGEIDVSKV